MKRFLKPAKLPVMCQNKAIFTSLRVSVMWHLAFGGRPYDNAGYLSAKAQIWAL